MAPSPKKLDNSGLGGNNTARLTSTQRHIMKNRSLIALFSLALCTFSGALTSRGEGNDEVVSREVASTVAKVSLPEKSVDKSTTNFVVPVTTSAIEAKSNLVGFQGDFTFDERVVTFQNPPVQKAGVTNGNWNISANVLPGEGPIRTLRISAFSNDFAPLNGSGTLFELKMTKVAKATQGTPLTWAAAPNHFYFIDTDLNTQKPVTATGGNITPSNQSSSKHK